MKLSVITKNVSSSSSIGSKFNLVSEGRQEPLRNLANSSDVQDVEIICQNNSLNPFIRWRCPPARYCNGVQSKYVDHKIELLRPHLHKRLPK